MRLNPKYLLKKCSFVYVLSLLMLFNSYGFGQKAISTLLSDPLKQADDAYINGNYQLALEKYLSADERENKPKNIDLRIARSYYFTHHYAKAVDSYHKYLKVQEPLSAIDQYYFAEALSSNQDYALAIKYYTEYLKSNPNKNLVSAKIWRINNLSYLFEDSLKNAVHYAEINTKNSEIQMVANGKGVLFSANQPTVALVKKVDKNGFQPFYHLFKATTQKDPFIVGAYFYDGVEVIGQKLEQSFNIGPVSLFDNQKQMVYAANSRKPNAAGYYNMQLYFAKKGKNNWIKNGVFEYSTDAYSITSHSISENGSTLYLSIDTPEGFGGKDLYVSHKIDGKWSKPENLGASINTEFDEVFPFIHKSGILYFASNGHPGIGGLDIFKTQVENNNYTALENLGFPVNSSYDDFAFSIDSLKQQGFLTSNRLNGGLDDDIYEVDMNLQSYPLEVNGIVKFIEHNWMDSTQLQLLANVKMDLIDISSNNVVANSFSSDEGTFQFTIPYYSQYKIHISGKGLDGMVSFEVPKYAKEDQSYQIVVVNDDFKQKLRE